MLVRADTRPLHTPAMLGAIVQALALVTLVTCPEAMALTLALGIAYTIARATAGAGSKVAVRPLPATTTLAPPILRVAHAMSATLLITVFYAGADCMLTLLAVHQRITQAASIFGAEAVSAARLRGTVEGLIVRVDVAVLSV